MSATLSHAKPIIRQVVDITVTVGTAEVLVRNDQVVLVDGKIVPLSPQQSTFMCTIANGFGKAIPRRHILSALYPNGAHRNQKIIDVLATTIRKSLEQSQAGAGRVVRTVRGRGYAFGSEPWPYPR